MKFGLGLASAAVMVSCGLEQGGTFQPVSDSPNASDASLATDVRTAPSDAGPDAAWPCGVDPKGCASLDLLLPTWTRVAYARDELQCPDGFVNPAHPVRDPVAPGGCICKVTSQADPNCLSGNGTLGFDWSMQSGTCNWNSSTYPASGGNCVPVVYIQQAPTHISVTPVAPINGSCTAAATPDTTKQTAPKTTVCEAAVCGEKLCAKQAPAGFAACLRGDGDLACPSGYPVKQLVGASATLTCGACSCQSTNPACLNPTLSWFSDDKCGALKASIAADGVCRASNTTSSLQSYRYTAQATATVVAGTSVATLALEKTKTLCCP